MAEPLHQFTIKKIYPLSFLGIDISFTNSSLFMSLSVLSILLFLGLGMRKKALVPGKLQAAAEMAYDFIDQMIEETVGVEGKKYFPYIFGLFLFILFANLLGMFPYAFTVTSHIIVTFGMAITLFVLITVVGFVRHGIGFLNFFVPHGAPKILIPMIVPIEIISYLVRPISLSLRLFLAMTVGHMLLKIVGGFILLLGVFGILPLALSAGLMGFEVFIAFLQTYIFTILTCLYLNDAIHMH